MKNLLLVFSLLLICCLAWQSALAQLDIPQKSPKANVSFRVGLTDVTITYSSPAVRGRGIWGKLVPYDKVWRAGANEATTIEFSTDVTVGGKLLPKGKYGLFLIPAREGVWIAIFNKVWDQWGAYQYEHTKDALRAQVAVKNLNEVVEHLRYRITEKDIENGVVVMEWERKQVSIPFFTDAITMTMANVEKALKTAKETDKWWIHIEAAEFLLEYNCDLDDAMAYTDASIALKPCVRNYWAKARLLAQKKDYAGALAAAEKATSYGKSNKEETEYYASVKNPLTAAMQQWKKQLK